MTGWLLAAALLAIGGTVAQAQQGQTLTSPGTVFRDCPECPEMVVIPAGTFTMGTAETDAQGSPNERPTRSITIDKAFAMGKFELTFEEWDACVSARTCEYRPVDIGWGRRLRPVINVSFHDTQAFFAWLSRKTGKSYRLPSESEWEYAARAGTTTPFSTGLTLSTDQANYDGQSSFGDRKGIRRDRTAQVGMFAPNGFGLYDVHGNVSEMVLDCWNETYRGAPSDGQPWLTGECSRRVVRGGSWRDDARSVRSAARYGTGTDNRYWDRGFRVARTLD